ncbi:MAG: hypothetical protein COB53_03405 [Elusimicrobia bacterium]|nr:MAG: hypothetical protein COB53_03405 [Elusimicrobiota bacterium]
MHRKLFYFFNFACLALFVAAGIVDNDREWKGYQKEYKRMEIARIEKALSTETDEAKKASLDIALKAARSMPIRLRQAMSKDLIRYDRCTSCHLGIDPAVNALQVNDYTEHPFKASVVPEHMSHPPVKFACTSCHGGQGLATTAEDAHGEIKHWEEPLLAQPYLQGTCVRCHDNFEDLEGAQEAKRGKDLVAKLGCVGCHSFKGKGGEVSVDLGDIADKPVSRIDWSQTTADLDRHQWNVKNWIELHLTRDPMSLVPGDPFGHSCEHLEKCEGVAPSGMPPFFEELSLEEAQAITAYMLGMTDRALPMQYKVPAVKKPVRYADNIEHGKAMYTKFGCAGCHGEGGADGRRNFNALGDGQDKTNLHSIEEMAKGREPTLTKVVGTYSRDELRKKLVDGVSPTSIVKFNPEGPTPPLFMPAWKTKIKGKEMEVLLDYLLSIAEDSGEEW